jgi:hypothetical protein
VEDALGRRGTERLTAEFHQQAVSGQTVNNRAG